MSFKCNKCPYITRHISHLKAHQQSVHSDVRPWKCSHSGCAYTAKLKTNLKKHMKTHEQARKLYPCNSEGCAFKATTPGGLKGHILARHTAGRTRNIQCPLCPARFYSQGHLTSHIPSHVREKRLGCKECNFKSDSTSHLAVHVRAVHNKITVKCPFPDCTYSTCWPGALKGHQRRTHNPDPLVRRPFPCSIPGCPFRASSLGNLNQHVRNCHNPNRTKQFACPLCANSFYNQNAVQNHIKSLHFNGQSVRRCDKRNFVTRNEEQLRNNCRNANHELDGRVFEPKFSCKLCGYKTDRKSSLHSHKTNTHVTKTHLKCHVRDCKHHAKSFRGLKYHLLTHEEDPLKQFPLSCPIPGCDYRRKLKSEMKSHLQVHAVSKLKIKCQWCPEK